ncbi:MAG: hypothetical protein LBD75_02070 [Candidatus Peribacteria bacterium]|jgi:hypothetical protein|nr:hypothetical protein [Candidatus Peribacteria bacterium]
MKKPTKNLITGKVDTHTLKLENKTHELTMQELKKTREINDGGKRTPEKTTLALYPYLSLTPYQSKETVLHTKKNLLLVLRSDGNASSEIPVAKAA